MSPFGEKQPDEPAGPAPYVVQQQQKKPRSGLNKAIRTILTAIIITLFAITTLVIFIKSSIAAANAAGSAGSVTGPITGAFSLTGKGILQYNNVSSVVEFAKIRYSMSNVQHANATIDVYTSNPVRKIYLVDVQGYCSKCFLAPSIRSSLNYTLRKYGLIFNSSSFNFVNINNIDQVPPESIIIIPSGLMPNILFPNITYTNLCPKYSNSSMLSLVASGDILVYIGANFSRSVTCSGQVVQTSQQSLDSIYPTFNTTTKSNGNFTNSSFYLTTPTYSFRFGRVFGPVAAKTYGADGAILVLSNYPDVGWNSTNTLADDIARTISTRFWIREISNGTTTVPVKQNESTFTIFSTNTPINNVQTITNIVNSTYTLVRVRVNNTQSYAEFDVPLRIRFRNNGQIGLPSTIGLGDLVNVTGQIFNASSSQHVIAYAQAYNQNLTFVNNTTVHFGQLSQTKEFVQTTFDLPSGYYIINLTDQNGNLYSSALFFVANVVITPIKFDFRNSTFTFLVYSNGHPVRSVPYAVSLNGVYNYSNGYLSNGILIYKLPKGTVVNYGNKNFVVKILGVSYIFPYNYLNPGINIPPLYIEVAIEVIIVLLIAKFIVPPNADDYYIDVPDVRPVQKQVLKENSDAIVDVFTKVNNYYHWRDMPLTIDEIKMGISNYIRYGNARVSITGRNAFMTVNKLVAKGVLEEAGEYYAPKKWTQLSNHSIAYLVIYRKLRDFCVANAMLFTELDTSSNIDMIITNKSTSNYIKIYTDDLQVKDIDIKQGARMFIAFLDEEKRLTFLDRLYMSYGQNAEILKMGISYGNIRLIDTNHLEELKL